MRLSLRKVVKLTTFLTLVFTLNVWISYNVNFWSFNNFDDRGKVLSSWIRSEEDNGGVQQVLVGGGGSRLEGLQQSLGLLNHTSGDHFRELNKTVHPQLIEIVAEPTHGSNLVRESEKVVNLLPMPEQRSNKSRDGLQHRTRKKQVENSVGSRRKLEVDETQLKDIFISVKTTSKYHGSRVKLLLKTWYLLAREQVYFFTDSNDTELADVLGDHLINTNCSTDHSRRALSCKMSVEFDYYMASRKRWFCHMDDDVYLNVPRLVELLQGYNHKDDWYLGKPSLKHPLEVTDRETPGMKLTFWFATGGAGFCISRSLALKMAPYAGGGRFMTTAENIRLPDDCTLGYIIEYLLKHKLTVVEEFHSHLEALWLIKPRQLEQQITLSFSEYSGKQNVINIQGFNVQEDPTRFKSLHCFLFPNFRECRVLL